MKVYARFGEAEGTKYCHIHKDRIAQYRLDAVVFGSMLTRFICSACICDHFNIQVFFTFEDGMELPSGVVHDSSKRLLAGCTPERVF